MNKLVWWLCHKWIWVDRSKYKELQKQANLYNQQFKPENALILEQRLKHFDADVLKALLQELKSTKNALLIEEKKYSNPVEIAYRDWAIITVNILINKIVTILKNRVTDDD